MKSVETEGKTIEEAISKACEELKVSREQLDIEVLTDGSSGFLGLMAMIIFLSPSPLPK